MKLRSGRSADKCGTKDAKNPTFPWEPVLGAVFRMQTNFNWLRVCLFTRRLRFASEYFFRLLLELVSNVWRWCLQNWSHRDLGTPRVSNLCNFERTTRSFHFDELWSLVFWFAAFCERVIAINNGYSWRLGEARCHINVRGNWRCLFCLVWAYVIQFECGFLTFGVCVRFMCVEHNQSWHNCSKLILKG